MDLKDKIPGIFIWIFEEEIYMTYQNAKKLHNEDEIIVKETNCPLFVVSVKITDKVVYVECDDGSVYHHRDIK